MEENKNLMKKEVTDSLMDRIMSGTTQPGMTYLRFAKGTMQIKNVTNQMEVTEVIGRIIFLTTKYELKETIKKKKEKIIKTVYSTTEMFPEKNWDNYLVKYGFEDEKRYIDNVTNTLAEDMKYEVESIVDNNNNLKKERLNCLYIDTDDGLIQCNLRYTQTTGNGDLNKPLENTFQDIKMKSRDYYKGIYKITMEQSETDDGDFKITYPIFELIEKKDDPELVKKVFEVINIIKQREDRMVDRELTEEEIDSGSMESVSDDEELPF